MKNIMAFESEEWDINSDSPIKNYGEGYQLEKITNGDKITYSGTPCEVIEASPYLIIVKALTENPMEFKINQGMFNERVFIGR